MSSGVNRNIDDVHKEIVDEQLTEEDLAMLSIIRDPVRWTETHLMNPDDPMSFLQLRWYQREMIRYQPESHWDTENLKTVWTKRKKLYRCGRRVGKSVVLLAEMLWLAYTNKNYKILLVTPFEQQMRSAWNVMRAMMGANITPSRIVEKPFVIEFSNGSRITGLVAGSKQKDGGRGSSIRGEGADCIGVMEMDHGIDHVLKAVLTPIFLGKSHCRWIGDSTPSGQRGLFYQWCVDGENKGGAKEFFFPSSISPEWNEEAEITARRSVNSDAEYEHEYLADWGEVTQGIYKTEDLEECLFDYAYDIEDIKLDCLYSMGVDWNQAFGVKIFIIEYNKDRKTFRTFYRHEVPNDEYTQTSAVNVIIELSKRIPLSWIYVDRGFGTVQVELLHKYGKEHPESNLQRTVKAIDFKGNVELRDPWTKQKIKKPLKQFAVANSARIVENRAISIPESEDHKFGLAGQMRGYKQYVTPADNIVFTAENRDDLLVAWILALLAFTIETGEFTRYEAIRTVGQVRDPFKLEEKFNRTDNMAASQGANNILGKLNPGIGTKIRRFKPIIPGSGPIELPKRDAPPGSIIHPFRRSGMRRREGPPQRSNF